MNIGSLFSSLQTVGPETRSEATSAREERRQALADAKLSDARAAVESLKQRTSSASEEKKAAAKKKIEEIKARLQMLQMAMIGDPKGAARMAAALARELGAAVKAYAAAGGSSAGLGAASGAPATGAPGTGGAEAAPDAGEVSAETPPVEAPVEEAEAARASNPYQQAIDASQARINEQARRSGERQADRDTMDEVKRLAARIKAMAQRVKDSPESDEAERAVAGMDREVQAAMRSMPDVGVALKI
jgi:hypothetical protein